MDNFHEQLVAKKRTGGDIAKIVIILVVSILLGLAVILFSLLLGLGVFAIFGAALIVLGIWLSSGFDIEYEYIVTNNEMDVDKIIGKRKRKRMITVDISRTTAFEPYSDTQSAGEDVTVQASTGMEKDAYCLVCEHNDYGKVRIIFNPDEITRKAITQELPRLLKQKVNDNG